jgi:hypothetical protein
MSISKVVLPAPFGPIRDVTLPLGNCALTLAARAAVAFFDLFDVDHAVPRVRTMSARKYAPHTRLTRMPTVVR